MKTQLDDLALFGGPPAFDELLHVGRPNIGDRARLMARIEGALDRRWLTNHGPLVQEFEQRLAAYVGVRHCIAMCNATVALEIAIRAAGLSGEVIVPSMTFIATAHALQWQQITPVFCDVEPETFTLDPARVEALITPRTTGIIGVHLWGRPCQVDALAEIAARHNLRLLYDAAHAFACTHNGRLVGQFGDAEIFSFHATKFFNSFEGGAVATNDDALAERVRLMQNFGFAGYDEVIYVGTNGKMTEVCAAMGLTSLESLDEVIACNQSRHARYAAALAPIPGLRLLPYDERERTNYQYIVVEVDETEAGLSRDQLVALLWAEQVRARRYFYPGCHRMEPYATLFPEAGAQLPVTERAVHQMLTLPTGTAVTLAQVDALGALLAFLVAHATELRPRLAARQGATP